MDENYFHTQMPPGAVMGKPERKKDEDELKIECKNLNDELKLRVLKAAFEIYELDELIQRLEIKNY